MIPPTQLERKFQNNPQIKKKKKKRAVVLWLTEYLPLPMAAYMWYWFIFLQRYIQKTLGFFSFLFWILNGERRWTDFFFSLRLCGETTFQILDFLWRLRMNRAGNAVYEIFWKLNKTTKKKNDRLNQGQYPNGTFWVFLQLVKTSNTIFFL